MLLDIPANDAANAGWWAGNIGWLGCPSNPAWVLWPGYMLPSNTLLNPAVLESTFSSPVSLVLRWGELTLGGKGGLRRVWPSLEWPRIWACSLPLEPSGVLDLSLPSGLLRILLIEKLDTFPDGMFPDGDLWLPVVTLRIDSDPDWLKGGESMDFTGEAISSLGLLGDGRLSVLLSILGFSTGGILIASIHRKTTSNLFLVCTMVIN